MNTTENKVTMFTKACRQIGDLLGAIGSLFKGVNGLITAAIALFGTLTTLLIINSNPDPPNPVPDNNVLSVTPVHHEPDPIPVPTPSIPATLNVSGTWYDDAGTPLQMEQDGSTVRLVMTISAEIGISVQMAGSGIMNNQSVHMELGSQVLGQDIGEKMPIDITFLSNSNATLAMHMGATSISGNLRR